MNTKGQYLSAPASKKAYKTPKLKVLGKVKKMTQKLGSATDGFGGSFEG
ncbi:hypothetical protein [Runella rosea]|nr:hypothetical protein [Runella rosea]